MAATDRWVASMTLRDGVGRDSVFQFYVSATDGKAYMNAAQGGTRDATLVGVLFAKLLGITDCVPVQQSVQLEQMEDTVPAVADTVLRGNKLKFTYRAGGSTYGFTVPGRELAGYSQQPDSLKVDLITPTAMVDFISAYEGVAKSLYGATPLITAIAIVD